MQPKQYHPTHLIHFSCADAQRLPMLWAALSSIVAGKSSFIRNRVVVRICYNSDDRAILDTNNGTGLRCFERHFNKVVVESAPGAAVPSMFCSSVRYAVDNGIKMVAKLDDDCFYSNVDFFLSRSLKDYNCMCFWDQENSRGYPDWYQSNSLNWQDRQKLIDKHGEKTLWAQAWDSTDSRPVLLTECKVAASLFCVDAITLLTSTAFGELLAIPPKVRGMDAIVPTAFEYKWLHSCAVGEHYGIWRPQLDGQYWNGYAEEYSVTSEWQS